MIMIDARDFLDHPFRNEKRTHKTLTKIAAWIGDDDTMNGMNSKLAKFQKVVPNNCH